MNASTGPTHQTALEHARTLQHHSGKMPRLRALLAQRNSCNCFYKLLQLDLRKMSCHADSHVAAWATRAAALITDSIATSADQIGQ